MRLTSFALVLALSFTSACSIFSSSTDEVKTYPHFTGVAYGNNIYVAVGENGVIVSSTNGKDWTRQKSNITTGLKSVAFGRSKFVAAGQAGIILTSTDGLTWTPAPSTSNLGITTVTFALDMFITVGAEGTILTSSDGITWTQRHSGTPWIADLAFSGSLFVAVEGGGSGILTSPDGITWTRTEKQFSGQCAITYANSTFVSVSYTGEIRTSADGIEWTLQMSGIWFDSIGECDIKYDGDTFVIAATDNTIMSSADGKTWNKLTTEKATGPTRLVFDGSKILGVGWTGTGVWINCTSGTCDQLEPFTIGIPYEAPANAGSSTGTSTGTSSGSGKACGSLTCTGKEICVSSRGCIPNSMSSGCSCSGSTTGQCFDYSTLGYNVTQCGTCNDKYTACCPGTMCVAGTCKSSCP